MHIDAHDLAKEFPELRDVLERLDLSDRHFHRLLEAYRALDKEIILAEEDVAPMADAHLEPLKMRRVHLKDELYAWLLAAKARLASSGGSAAGGTR